MLKDGRVGFIDFGIVGSISPATWRALETLMTSSTASDYTTMARALATLGATRDQVDVQVCFAACSTPACQCCTGMPLPPGKRLRR